MNRSLVLSALLALAAASAAAQTEAVGKELGDLLGRSTARIEFAGPGAAAKQPTCTGVLVAPNVLLTAAHCWGAAAGEARGVSAVTFRGASGKAGEARRDEGYAGKEERDFALLAFDASALKDRRPAVLDSTSGSVKKGSVLIAGSAGPGQAAASGMPATARLRVERVDKEKGLAYAAGEKGACWTDSGSPVFLATKKGPRVAGVVSRPNGADCKEGDAVVVALVAPREAWLKKSVEALSSGKTADGGSTWGKKPP